jgi:diacylglycerol O-acyltransferase
MLPDRPLLAFVPVSMDRPAAIPRAVGNRFTHLTTSLATDVADPWERLRMINAVTAEAKVRLDLAGRELLADWLEFIPPMLMNPMVRRGQAVSLRPGKPPKHNVLVSNVRGPSVPWQLGSTLVEEMYLAPPSTGIGVNFVFWDYAGSLRFGILSFAESIEDPNELAMRLSSSLEELVAAADCAGSRRADVHASFSRWSAAAAAPPAAAKELRTRRAAAW